jgi:carbamoyl-phosphate synthase large subunit
MYSAGQQESNHAPYVFSRHFVVPSVHDADWIGCLNQVIVEQGIDYVFPAHDDVVLALAENASQIQARVVSSPHRTCAVTRSKSRTYRLFSGHLPVPRLYSDPVEEQAFPVFVKPDASQGSRGTRLVLNRQDLDAILGRTPDDLLIMEYLPGDEYTVDCFSLRDSGLLYFGARQRVRTRSGISMNSRLENDAVFEEYARIISSQLTFHGAWFFQIKRDCSGICRLLEIAPRIAGTMALHRVLGVNFPLLSIYEQEGIPIEIRPNRLDVEIDRALANRYRHQVTYNAVYVDLDDLLILDGKVNVDLIRFLFQCANRGLRLILLTKHGSDLTETLQRYRLAGFFDQVIHIDKSACKADYITEHDAIFIDDSFTERKQVSERLGLLTFDGSMLEMLMDDRM